MKKLLPILFLLPCSSALADMTSTITSSVQIEVMSAATAADRVANSYSVSGSGVTTTDGTTAGVVGGLGAATNGVNAFTTITASLGFQIKKKKDTIVDNKNNKVGIK